MASFNDLTALFSLGTKVGVNMSSCTAQTTAEAIKYITTNYTVPAQLNSNVTALTDLGTALGVTMTSCTATTDAGVIDFIADNYVAPSGGGGFVAVISPGEDNDFVCDKTYAEIAAAIEAGESVSIMEKMAFGQGVYVYQSAAWQYAAAMSMIAVQVLTVVTAQNLLSVADFTITASGVTAGDGGTFTLTAS